jgi:hypothetical protein
MLIIKDKEKANTIPNATDPKVNGAAGPSVEANDTDVSNDSPVVPGQEQGTCSQRKLAANRRNALLSTGPKNTRHTRHNALKDGYTAKFLTKLDDPDAYEENMSQLKAHYGCDDPFAKFFIHQAAMDMVREERINQVEADAFSAVASDQEAAMASDGCASLNIDLQKEYLLPVLDRTNRYRASIHNRLRQCRRALGEINEEQKKAIEEIVEEQRKKAIAKHFDANFDSDDIVTI